MLAHSVARKYTQVQSLLHFLVDFLKTFGVGDKGVRNFADFPFADRTFADRHLLIRHLLTGPGHLLTQTFADFSHPCHLLTLEGRLLIQTFADPDNR